MKYLNVSIFFTLILFSCNKKVSNEIPQAFYEELEYKMIFPDTVSVNQPYKTIIEFESDFDNIMPPVQVDALSDSTKMRLITFYRFEPIKSPMKSINELVLIDSSFVLNKSFVINDIVFNEKGEFVFCGLIKDVIMYNHYNDKGIRDTVHFEERKQQIFKKVVVVE